MLTLNSIQFKTFVSKAEEISMAIYKWVNKNATKVKVNLTLTVHGPTEINFLKL